MPEQVVTLPNCQTPRTLPAGWSVDSDAKLLTLVAPERDLRMAMLVRPKEGSAEDMAIQAWHELDPAFECPVLQKAEMPSSKGWESTVQIVYNVGLSEGKTAFTILRTLQGQAYICLVVGSTGAANRRMAQVSEIVGAWRPGGLRQVDLASKGAATWGEGKSRLLGEFIEHSIEVLGIPGTAIAVVQGGQVVYAAGFGVCQVGRKERVTPDTQFMIGSSTKPLTSLLMARLIDQGCFSWTTPVLDLLPDFALADAEMTRRLQMQHTVCACTGMPRRDIDFVFRFDGISAEQRLAEMKTMQPTTGFGETFQYSNLLVALGGYAAARSFITDGLLGPAYEAAIRRLIFEPLGMKSSGFLAEQPSVSERAAAPHARDIEERCVTIDPALERSVVSVAPAGGAWSTVLDLANYLLLEMHGGKTPEGEPLLTEANLRRRWRGGVKINDKAEYGLGLMRTEEDGLEVIGHGGNTFGFTSDLYFLPAHGFGVAVLTNLRVANGFHSAVRQKVFEIVFGAESVRAR